MLWDPNTGDVGLTLQGVGVEFSVPGAVSFKGSVSMTQPAPGITRFDGEIDLNLIALSMEIDAQLVVGYDADADSAFFAVYLAIELPAGIPLWATGLGLYGMAGLFAYHMEPDRAPDEAWYDIPPADDWYAHAGGVAQLPKWRNQADALAIGAGVTIGTEAGQRVHLRRPACCSTIVFPGPILLHRRAVRTCSRNALFAQRRTDVPHAGRPRLPRRPVPRRPLTPLHIRRRRSAHQDRRQRRGVLLADRPVGVAPLSRH